MAYTNEPRPCVVDGCRALFHGWAELEKPNIENGRQVGRWKNVVAVAEMEDGTIKMVTPEKIRFSDSDKMFTKDFREE